jgi:uroporphyrinogen-III synthase
VLITRPSEQAGPFAEALRAAGATPIVYPTIAVEPPPSWRPLDDALARRADYGWAVFTSPSAVAFTTARAAAIGIPAPSLATMRIAAVGSETARALAAAGLTAAIVPAADAQRQEGLVDGIVAALREARAAGGDDPPPPARILFPQAIGGRELLRDELVRRGCVVDVVPVSQTIERDLPEPPPDFDVATFASPSALRAFVRGQGRERLGPAVVAAIGPTTADAAAALGVRVDVVPASPSMKALIEALVVFRRQHN